MEAGHYLQVVRRRWRIVVVLLVLGLGAGVALHLKRTPVYEATAQVLLLPNDPAERVDGQTVGNIDLASYAAVEISVMTAHDVAERAARRLRITPEQVQGSVSVSTAGSPSVLDVTGRSTQPRRASAVANALIDAFIADRKQTSVAALTKAADEIDAQLLDLNQRIVAIQVQNRGGQQSAALAGAYQQYTNLIVRQSDLRVESTLKKGEARVLTVAPTPGVPTGRSLSVDALLGGLLGLMLGLGLAFFRDQIDDRVRLREELEPLTGVPVLAELPNDKLSAKREGHIGTHAEPLGALAEATRSLRTSITFLGVEEPIHRFAVTSAMPGEGKTLVSANLAAAFAQAGLRTVLVSADLRRSRLEAALGLERSYEGLSTVLVASGIRGSTSQVAPLGASSTAERQHWRRALLEALVATPVPGLTLLPAGHTPPNPAELLGSRRMDDVLDELDEMFDLTIIDTSPVLPVTDAAAVAAKAHHVIVVASAGLTRRRALERTMSLLERTQSNVIGLVLNRAGLEATIGGGGYYGVHSSESFRSRTEFQDDALPDVQRADSGNVVRRQ